MIPSSKVLWGEGLFLRPQHFQRQDAYHEWRLAEAMRALHPYAWGVRRLAVDASGLAGGVLRLDELSLVFPDGEQFSAPAEDALPPPVNLAALPAQAVEVVFHAAIAPMRQQAGNVALDDAADAGAVHYRRQSAEMVDLFTQAAQAEVSLLQRSVRLLADHEPRDHLVSVPVCRVRRNAAGAFDLDPRFVAPSLSVQAAPALAAMLRRLLDMLQAKVAALYGFHREPSKHVIEFRSGDTASFWLLHVASTACAALLHLRQHPGFHPERLYERMMELAGALMTFSKTHTLSDLPAYDHERPEVPFARLEAIVRELLETVISTRYFAIALAETKPSFHIGRLDSEQITPATSFVLGVSAAMPAAELVDAVPLRFKVGAPDDVDKLVLSAMGGVRLVHVPQTPAAIPVRPGAYYFAFEGRGPLYERMLQAQAVTIYTPAGMPDLQLELFALNQ
ncbi:type VI secretion system baseplate subunit TssK [Pseudorhodoferax sp.]|uniref:type VI secretion system baseplate subunit TssK n=1 Tax=Pseudorhodoferax sp. TaxID=1993553 RepID=UPI0039E3D8E4